MSTATVLAIVLPILAVLAVVVVLVASRKGDARRATGALSKETVRSDRSAVALSDEAPTATGREVELAAAAERRGGSTAVATVSTAVPAPYTPPDEETLGVTRRQFFNRTIITLFAFSLSGFGAAVVAFLWPKLSGGFGSKISIGKVDDVIATIRANNNFFYLPEGRAWITEFPKEGLAKAKAVYPANVYAGMEAGLVALYQKCPHLGCRVPECATSQWFECGCHGSQYDRIGERRGGPAPRGMDHFAVSVSNGVASVDTGSVIPGAPNGTNTIGQEAEGPHCISAGGGH